MKFRLQHNDMVLRARVTPDIAQAAALRQKLEALSYQPSNGFHKDQWESRHRHVGVPRNRPVERSFSA